MAVLLGSSLAPRQATARRAIVVLDAGHGGSNLGAAGRAPAALEKRLTLAITKEVARLLEDRADVDVVLTRRDDRFITLRERVRLANKAGGDLFLSIHLNASPDHLQQGFETWIVSPEALDVDARAMRWGDGPTRPGVSEELAAMLDDVERGAALPRSAALAARMQARLGELRGVTRGRGVMQGSQDVLLGLGMPGALVEVGFIDHATEGEELLDPAVRSKIAGALAQAIIDWLGPRTP